MWSSLLFTTPMLVAAKSEFIETHNGMCALIQHRLVDHFCGPVEPIIVISRDRKVF